eukprot:513610-Alexandrium_andersonii.AAC.1
MCIRDRTLPGATTGSAHLSIPMALAASGSHTAAAAPMLQILPAPRPCCLGRFPPLVCEVALAG